MARFSRLILLTITCFLPLSGGLSAARPKEKCRPLRYRNRAGVIVIISAEQQAAWDKMSWTCFDNLSAEEKILILNNQWRTLCASYLPTHLSGKDIYKELVKFTTSTAADIEIEKFVDYLDIKKSRALGLYYTCAGACLMTGIVSSAAILIDHAGTPIIKIVLPITLLPAAVGVGVLIYACYLRNRMPSFKRRKKTL